MITSKMGRPGEGMSFQSTPPVENSNPERVAPQGADGQGVCTISNPCQLHLDTGDCACQISWSPLSVRLDQHSRALADLQSLLLQVGPDEFVSYGYMPELLHHASMVRWFKQQGVHL